MTMIDQYKRRNLEQRISIDADQTEFAAMLSDAVLVDAGLFDDRISGALDDFNTDDDKRESWHTQDLQIDTAVGEIHGELLRRATLLGDMYPFEITQSQVKYRGSKSYFYEFCLAISSAPTLTQGENVQLPRLFERISALIVKMYMGYDSYSVHVGSPRDQDIGTTFYAAMQKVKELTGEWIWGPVAGFPEKPTTTGDEGIDFIVWKETPDKRPGKLFVIGQCACGDDWKDKFNDLSFEKLSKWFNLISYVRPPIRAFALPHHLSDFNIINSQIEAGMVFDRARLSIIAERFASEPEIADWLTRIKELSNMIIC